MKFGIIAQVSRLVEHLFHLGDFRGSFFGLLVQLLSELKLFRHFGAHRLRLHLSDVVGLEREVLLFQHCGPLGEKFGKAARRVGSRENGGLSHALRCHQDVDAAVHLGQQEVGLVGDVELAVDFSLFRQTLEALLVPVARVEKQQRVEVVALVKALLSEGEQASTESDVADLAPLLIRLLLLGDTLSHLHVLEGDRQLELMVQVRRQFESHLFLPVELEELRQLAMVASRDLGQQALSLLYLVLQDADLEAHHREQ